MSDDIEEDTGVFHWNYRVVKTISDQKPRFAIHEVYYDKDNNMTSMTERAVSPSGKSLDDLEALFIAALKKPIVVWDEKLKKPMELTT